MVQNAAARLIRKVPFRHHISPHLRSLHWLPVNRRIKYKALTLAYRATRERGPGYLRHRLQNYHKGWVLKSNYMKLLRIPSFFKARIGGRALSVRAAALWNSMSLQLRLIESDQAFRKALKTWLFNLL